MLNSPPILAEVFQCPTCRVPFLLVSLLALAFLLQLRADEPKPVPPEHAARMAKSADLFKSHIGPLLKANCLRCHGGKKTESGLDISNRDKLLKGGEHGAAIVPGDAKKSLLYMLASAPEDPAHARRRGEVAASTDLTKLAQSIDLGAAYDVPLAGPDPKTIAPGAGDHWSFRRPVRGIPEHQNPNYKPDRRVRLRQTRSGRVEAGEARRETHADPSRHVRPDRSPANTRGGRRVRRGPVTGCLREAYRPPARVARVRRTMGPALARPGALLPIPSTPAGLAEPKTSPTRGDTAIGS